MGVLVFDFFNAVRLSSKNLSTISKNNTIITIRTENESFAAGAFMRQSIFISPIKKEPFSSS